MTRFVHTLYIYIEAHKKRLVSLEDELKSIELVEKRRSEVGLDNEKGVSQARYRIEELRRELEKSTGDRIDLQNAFDELLQDKKYIHSIYIYNIYIYIIYIET